MLRTNLMGNQKHATCAVCRVAGRHRHQDGAGETRRGRRGPRTPQGPGGFV